MPNFEYTARDEKGKQVTGTLVAPTTENLADQLKGMGYLVTKYRAVKESSVGGKSDDIFAKFRHVGYEDMVMFNVQLSTMIRVGIPLVTALDTLTKQTEHPQLNRAICDVAKNVEAGMAFSQALSKHPTIYSELFVSMVHAGEISGKLEEILSRLAEHTKRQAELRQQVVTAMTYPMVLIVVGIGVMAFLILGIIPKFMKIFLDTGVALPLPTLILHHISLAVRQFWYLFFGVVAMSTYGFMKYRKTDQGKRVVDKLMLKIPVLGELVRRASLSRMTRTLSTLLSSGVPILECLSIAEKTCGNVTLADVCHEAQESVRAGGNISDTLKDSGEFPPMVVQMVTIGESSGTLDVMLEEIAMHYDEMVRHSLKRLTTLIEPLFLVVLGGMVAFIMASVLLPLFRMVNVVK